MTRTDLISRKETIFSRVALEPIVDVNSGVGFLTFASHECDAVGFSTGLAIFAPGALLPSHTHPYSEAVTVLEGYARMVIEGRAYRLGPYDCVHVPAGVVHSGCSDDPASELVAHTSFASEKPARELSARSFPATDRGLGNPTESDPETILRWENRDTYELSPGAFFNDLFARRFGSKGICGGYGHFGPGSSLPCHTHDYDESITIVEGTAVCLVQGRRYELSGRDTAFIPRGIPHRFLNSSGEGMAMIWVYAGDEPDREIVDAHYCSGELAWLGEGSPLRLPQSK